MSNAWALLLGLVALIGAASTAGAGASPGRSPEPPTPVAADAAAATSRAVAQQATVMVASDLTVGLLLGLEAFSISPTPEAFRAVVRGLERAEGKSLMTTAEWGVTDLALAGGRMLAALSFDPRWSLDRDKAGDGLPTRPGIIKLWTVSGPALGAAATIGRGELVSSIAVRPDAKLLAAGSASSPIVRLWTLGDQARPDLRDLGDEMVTAVAFDPDGALLASGSQHGIIRLSRERAPMRYALERTLRYRHNGAITSLAFSPLRRDVLASASTDGAIALWHLDRAAPPVFLGDGGAMASLAFGPDGRTLATVGLDSTFALWNTTDGQRLVEIPAPAAPSAAAFKPDGTSIAVGGANGRVRVYRRGRDGKRLTPVSPDIVAGPDRITSIAFSRDGKVLAVGTERRLVLLEAGLESWASRACRIAGRELTRDERARFLPGQPAESPRCAAVGKE